MQIVHIASIKKNESKNINLVAVTKFGIRLYFSINQFEQVVMHSPQANQNENSGNIKKKTVELTKRSLNYF